MQAYKVFLVNGETKFTCRACMSKLRQKGQAARGEAQTGKEKGHCSECGQEIQGNFR